MPTYTSAAFDMYKAKMISLEIVKLLRGNYFGAQVFNDSLTLNSRIGFGRQMGDTITIPKEVSMTFRDYLKGDTRQFDRDVVIPSKTLVYDQSNEVNVGHSDYDRALYNDEYRPMYVDGAVKTIAVGLEKKFISSILSNSDIPGANTISLANFSNKFSYQVVNEAIRIMENQGMVSGMRVRAVIDPTRAAQYRDSLTNYNVVGDATNTQILNTRLVSSYGVELFSALSSGVFNRMPTATTSDGVSGTNQIVGFFIAEQNYMVNGATLKTDMPGVNAGIVTNPLIPLPMRFMEWYDADTKDNKFGYDFVWGDVLMYPELVVPITL